MQKRARLQPEQAALLLKLVDNPLAITNENTRQVLDDAMHDHLVNRRRKNEIFEEYGILEEDFEDYMEDIARIHQSAVKPAFPERMERGNVAKDVFDAVGNVSRVDTDLLEDLQQFFVDGKQINLRSDTKRAMIQLNETFKIMISFRELLLADENFKDSVNVPVVEQDTEQVMYL